MEPTVTFSKTIDENNNEFLTITQNDNTIHIPKDECNYLVMSGLERKLDFLNLLSKNTRAHLLLRHELMFIMELKMARDHKNGQPKTYDQVRHELTIDTIK